MSKLIVSIATLGSGGAERVLSVLSAPLADNFDTVQYVLWEGGEPFYPIDKRVKIVSLPELSGKKGRNRQMKTFRRLIKRECPDLVLSFLTPYNMLVLLSTIGLKQNILVAERTDPRRLLSGGRAGLWLRDKLYHRADGILTQTEYAKSCYDEKFVGKTVVIYNPVMMSGSQVGLALRTQKEHVFVTAGRLEQVKDQTVMIKAFAVFHKNYPDYRLVIYGEGPMHEALQKQIRGLGLENEVVLAGRTNDLWNRISSAEAFLLTSEYEGMSNALIEAMCLGLPVISTKVAGATDLIKNGKNGYLIDVKDSEALAKCMKQLADNLVLREQMGHCASEVYGQVRQDIICKQWIEYLKSKNLSRIILVLTNNIGGLHSFRKEVMKAIVDAGYDVYISEPDDDERAKYFEGIGCHIIRTEFDRRGMNPVADLKLMLTYRKLIKQLKPKAVLSYTIKPNVYGGLTCRMTGTPQLANVTGLGDAIENGGWLQKLTLTLYRIGIKKAKCVFFQNQTNRDFCVSHGVTGEHTVLLPGSGVNLEHHQLQPYPEDGTIRFLFIARLLKDKGTEEYFEAARVIKKKYPNTEFQILGWCEGDYQQQLDELVKAGIINYLGSTSDVRPYLKDVHCTIMPSYHEGMSNVNLESAANGRPVITTNVPGCRETVDDGVTGYLVKPRSAEDLIAKVEKFILLPHEEKVTMGRAARAKMEREFDRDIVVKAYLNELEHICCIS